MEKKKKARGALRSSFTKKIQQLEGELSKEIKDVFEVRGLLGLLEKKREELALLNSQIYDALIANEDTDEERLEAELEVNDKYDMQLNKLKARIEALEYTNQEELARPSSVQDSTPQDSKRQIYLPKLELKRFNGELREWLPFWSQFKKIDEDLSIEEGDKYQYLIQATVPGSRARDLVESFPATSENYVKVIQCLKKRFGREELLVEVYVRDLLTLILHNMISPKKTKLSTLYDKLECQLRALETLQITTDRCAAMLMPLVESCLPEDILRAWQRSNFYAVTEPGDNKEDKNIFTIGETAKYRLDQLMTFLRSELENEQKINLALSGFGVEDILTRKGRDINPKLSRFDKIQPTAAGLLTTAKEVKCVFCGNSHDNALCDRATVMPLAEKMNILGKNRCCYNCLRPGHPVKSCWSKIRCATCKRKHHRLICDNLNGTEDGNKKSDIQHEKIGRTFNMNVQCNKETSSIKSSERVMLQTLLVKLKGENSQRVVRAILDCASQRSYILKDVAQDMGYKAVSTERVCHVLFGGVNTKMIDHEVYIAHLSDINGKYHCEFKVLDQNIICDGIDHIQPGPWLQELQLYDIQLTDYEGGPIEILIGADVLGRLYTGKLHELSSGLAAVETRLGWTVMGPLPEIEENRNIATMVTTLIVKEADIADLWSLDILGITDPSEKKKKQELKAEAEEHFLKTVTIDNEGRYTVHLPWLENHPPLPTNYHLAVKRLGTAIKKLKSDGLYYEYDAVFKEWEREGIIEKVMNDKADVSSHYLPHRHVVKTNSTTKLRPVFDASAKGKNSPSLNDCLEKGINLIELIPSILIRFRMEKIGVISDIRKAFLQISLFEKDRDFLRFLWCDKNGQLTTFRHKRVVFGVSSSPFLLGSVVRHHLQNTLAKCRKGDKKYTPKIIEKLIDNFYVDNCIISVENENELERFVQEATDVMREACFELRGWEYSHQDSIEHANLSNVLGLLWDKQNDVLKINVGSFINPFDNSQITKRAILSAAHRIFDPIGVTTPVIILPKALLQQIWAQKTGWDQPVTEDIKRQFLKWNSELATLEQVKISRWLIGTNESAECTLHVFCDASQIAYATSIFLRTETASGVKVELVQAKSRVCPVSKHNKKMTIPRLELLAANIGVRLYKSIVHDLSINIVRTTFWSDSTTVLAWISRDEQWDVFVRNRINEIKNTTSNLEWRYVPGQLNPADLPSRGCSAKKLVESQWWRGPSWLRDSENCWPNTSIAYDEREIKQERKKTVTSSSTLMNVNSDSDWYYKYFSKYKQIVRLVGWIMRFKRNSTAKTEDRLCGDLTPEEIVIAERKVIYLIQKDFFEDVHHPKLSSLCPYMDEDNIIRLRTQISNSDYDEEFCSPAILPDYKHEVVARLIWETHLNSCHASKNTLLVILRKRFWILGGRRSVKAVISRCPMCKRYATKRIEVPSPPLPGDRIREAKVFEVTGIDYAGPVYLRRKDEKTQEKAWICLFTCAVYRAVHLELVPSLSTDGFMQCLRRFISRRGRPKIIYTDNGTNFVGAANALARIDWRKISTSSAIPIEWKFNPPTAAWWGGWWERLIGLLKQLLRRILGRTSLNYEEMQTVLCECEAILNARPLSYLSEDPSDLMPLTPEMFLKEIEDSGVPDLDAVEAKDVSRRVRYRRQLRRVLKERFHSEYMGQLILHARKISPKRIEVGELVLVGSDNTKRIDWPMARVEEMIPGRDGVVRLVKLRTSSGILLRAIQRVFPLEIHFTGSEEEREVIQQPLTLSLEPDAEKEVQPTIFDPEDTKKSSRTRSGRTIVAPSKMNL